MSEAAGEKNDSAAAGAAPLLPFMHTFPATPIRAAYTAMAVRHGLNVYPVVKFEGRDCYVTGSQRIRQKKGWGFYNSVSVHFLDGTHEMIPAARFAKAARATA